MPKKITPETSEKIAIKSYLNFKGYFYYSNTAGFASYPGLPDITAIKDGVVWQIEVKAPGGKQSPKQVEFEQAWCYRGGNYVCGGIDQVMAAIK